MEILQSLASNHPEDAAIQGALAKCYGDASHIRTSPDAAISDVQNVIAIGKYLKTPVDRQNLGHAYVGLALLKSLHFANKGGQESATEANLAIEHAQEVFQALIEEDPENNEYQTDLADVFAVLGSFHRAAGRSEDADEYRRKCLKIRERLAAKNPNDVKLQRRLAAVYNETDNQEMALDIHKRLAQENPAVPALQMDLAQQYVNVADSQYEAGQIAESFVSRQAGLDILKKLVEAYPNNGFERTLGVHYIWLAQAQRSEGRFDEAVVSFKLAMTILEQADAYLGYQMDAHSGLAEILEDMGDIESAIANLQESVEKGDKLLERSPHQLHFHVAQSWAHHKLGRLQHKAGAMEAALVAFENALELLEKAFVDARTIEADPAHVPEADDSLRYHRREVVKCTRDLGRGEEVPEFLQQQLLTWEKLQKESPHPTECTDQRLSVCLQMADAWRRLGNTEEAERQYDKCGDPGRIIQRQTVAIECGC